jgi:hypothetical protein
VYEGSKKPRIASARCNEIVAYPEAVSSEMGHDRSWVAVQKRWQSRRRASSSAGVLAGPEGVRDLDETFAISP